MAELFSQYTSGIQFTAGVLAGSATGVSGLNPIVDRLNSVAPSDNLLSGTSLVIHASGNSTFNKTSYLSINGIEFLPVLDTSEWTRNITGNFTTDAGTIQAVASVHLPHNSVVTACVVYSNDTSESWTLARHPIDSTGAANTMATASMDTEDTSISDATIDNSARRYTLRANNQDATDIIYGARITYTANYD